MKNLMLLIAFVSCLSFEIMAQETSQKSAVLTSVEEHEAYYTKLLKEIVNLNSGTMNFTGVQAVGKVLRDEFDKLGMKTDWLAGESFNRAGHLVAETTPKNPKGPKLLLIGHLDTVFEPDSPFQSFLMVNDSIMKGPGVADMKGGDVIILMALRALKDANMLDNMQIKVVMTGDEEKSGSPLSESKKALIDAAKWADAALAFENADGNPETIVVARRGSLSWQLSVQGNAAHSSQVFTDKVGVGAIYEASRILNEFYRQLSNEENLTFNPGVILGGTSVQFDEGESGGAAFGKTNVVAEEVKVSGDIRAVSMEQLSRAKQTMENIVQNNYPGTSAIIKFNVGGYPPLPDSEGNRKLLELYSTVSQELGYGKVRAVNPRNAGAADVSFTAGHVKMAIDGMGLSGADDHTIRETGDLSKLKMQAERAALLMLRLQEFGF